MPWLCTKFRILDATMDPDRGTHIFIGAQAPILGSLTSGTLYGSAKPMVNFLSFSSATTLRRGTRPMINPNNIDNVLEPQTSRRVLSTLPEFTREIQAVIPGPDS